MPGHENIPHAGGLFEKQSFSAGDVVRVKSPMEGSAPFGVIVCVYGTDLFEIDCYDRKDNQAYGNVYSHKEIERLEPAAVDQLLRAAPEQIQTLVAGDIVFGRDARW